MEDRIYTIAGKKIAGQSINPEEKVLFSKWIEQEGNREIYTEMSQAWEITGVLEKQIRPDLDVEWERFKTLRNQQHGSAIRRHRSFYFSVAASIVLLLGLFFTYKTFIQDKEIEILAVGTKRQIQLPDGSLIWLNENSSIKYPSDFGKENRKIKFSGEAWFNVAKSEVPFEIYSPNEIVTKVLGTKFNLRTFKDEVNAELSVFEGKVSFGKENDLTKKVYTKNYEVIINTVNSKITEKEMVNANALSWRTEKLEFDNVQMTKVVLDLERYFGIKITVPPNTDSLFYTGRFSGPQLEEVADIMDLTFGWNHKIENRQLNFMFTY